MCTDPIDPLPPEPLVPGGRLQRDWPGAAASELRRSHSKFLPWLAVTLSILLLAAAAQAQPTFFIDFQSPTIGLSNFLNLDHL